MRAWGIFYSLGTVHEHTALLYMRGTRLELQLEFLAICYGPHPCSGNYASPFESTGKSYSSCSSLNVGSDHVAHNNKKHKVNGKQLQNGRQGFCRHLSGLLESKSRVAVVYIEIKMMFKTRLRIHSLQKALRIYVFNTSANKVGNGKQLQNGRQGFCRHLSGLLESKSRVAVVYIEIKMMFKTRLRIHSLQKALRMYVFNTSANKVGWQPPEEVPLLTRNPKTTHEDTPKDGKVIKFFKLMYVMLKLKQILQPPIIASVCNSSSFIDVSVSVVDPVQYGWVSTKSVYGPVYTGIVSGLFSYGSGYMVSLDFMGSFYIKNLVISFGSGYMVSMLIRVSVYSIYSVKCLGSCLFDTHGVSVSVVLMESVGINEAENKALGCKMD
ncbi:hypothetical protein Tco_0940707 [Tanacetum coccineum]|uniref:Uncharacterized protein n=1 Tax=Tanacetum coccineum TaxID=301880 RepID=A0ABQ5DP31_9ASTR